MRVARYCLFTLALGTFSFSIAGCSDDAATKAGPPGDQAKAYKSSDEAAKDMNKNVVIPGKK